MNKLGFTFRGVLTTLTLLTLFAGLVLPGQMQASTDDEDIFDQLDWLPLTYAFEGIPMTPLNNQKGFMLKDRVYVPLRFLAYSLNKAVEWNGDNVSVRIYEPATELERLTINEYQLNASMAAQRLGKDKKSKPAPKMIAYRADIKFDLSGKQTVLPSDQKDDQRGVLYDGTLYVPVRFVSEAFGQFVNWDEQASQVLVANTAELAKLPGVKPTDPVKDGTVPQAGAGGAAPGGGAGGGSKPSKDTIISETTGKLNALQTEAMDNLSALLYQYKNANDSVKKAELLSDGRSFLQSTMDQFYDIVNQAESALISNGYDTKIIQDYKDTFNAQIKIGETYLK